MKKITSLVELRQMMDTARDAATEQGRVAILAEHYVEAPELMVAAQDPYSREYRDGVAAIHATVSQRTDYRPAESELTPIDPEARALRPGIYADGGSKHLGMFLEAIGQILQVIDAHPGTRVVEYGAGDGQLALALARNGCDVTVVDIEERYLEAIRLQAQAIGVKIDCRLAEFARDEGLKDFDVVVFFEAFHHALDHGDMLDMLQRVLKPDGKIVFAGEPVIERGGHWARTVPFPWGLRLDGLSLSAVVNYGWMELGFQEGYFIELLMRHGWLAEKHASLSNGRGTCYVARQMRGCIDFSQPFMVDAWDQEAGWHGSESSGRWTGKKAILPVPKAATRLTLSVYNPLPWSASFVVEPERRQVTVKPGERLDVTLAGNRDRITIDATAQNLSALTEGRDTRVVGVMVERVMFA